MNTQKLQTHERYIQQIVTLGRARLNETERKLVDDAKIVYGAGLPGVRGATYFGRWQNGGGPEQAHAFVEICAFCEADAIQLAGTTLHEMAHVIEGHKEGHGAAWKTTCDKLGLRLAKAAGMRYNMAAFEPRLRHAIAMLNDPEDGKPIGSTHLNAGNIILTKPRPCSSTIGSHGGASRGKGSGSRMIRLSCSECGYIIRTTAKWLSIGAPSCPCNNKPMDR